MTNKNEHTLRPAPSVRLNGKSRAETVKNIMSEWLKKNPEPTTSYLLLEQAVMDSFKKSNVFKKMQSIKNTKPYLEDTDFSITPHLHYKTEDGSVQTMYITDALMERYPWLADMRLFKKHVNTQISSFPEQDHDLIGITEEDKKYQRYVRVHVYAVLSSAVVVIDKNSSFVKARDKALKVHKEWKIKHNQLHSEVSDFLEQVNTTKQLREEWPEIVDFLPPHIANPAKAISLPAIATSKLNERLGIK